MRLFFLFIITLFLIKPATVAAQQDSLVLPVYDYSEVKEFEIGGLSVEGAFFAEENAIMGVTGLSIGDKIRVPGAEIPKALRNLWRLRLFTDVAIEKEKTIGNVIFLVIKVQERPRLLRYSYKGVNQATHDDLNEVVNSHIVRGGIVTENSKVQAAEGIRAFFVEKGYLDTKVTVEEIVDTVRDNAVRLLFDIDRYKKVKIKNINFIGSENVKARKLRKQMKETREKRRLLASSKFQASEYETDKKAVIAYYNKQGYRDARIIKDSLYRNDKDQLVIDLYVNEGNRYYFRDIT